MRASHGMPKSRTRHLGLVRWVTSVNSDPTTSGFYISNRGLTQFSYVTALPRRNEDRRIRLRTLLLSGKVTERVVSL